MIIQIAGTSGSGKSHQMRLWLAQMNKLCKPVVPVYIDGRTAPYGYVYAAEKRFGADVFVPGSYEVPTGGCDTIHDVREVFKEVERRHLAGFHVVFEGLFVMNHTRGPQLVARLDDPAEFAVLKLTTSYNTCLASIDSRRAAQGEGRLKDKSNTKGNWVRAENYCVKMRATGAQVFAVARDEVVSTINRLLED